MVKIRLTRIGKKHSPYFRIIAIDSRKQRDGEALEILGTYNPTKGVIEKYNQERIEAWVAQGAQLTDSVKKLVKLHKKSAIA